MTATALEMKNGKPRTEPVSHAPETVLTFDQVLEWLQISETTADRIGLRDKLPYVPFGSRSKRYVVRQVLGWMDREAGI
jgi:hypothetical protein